MSFHGRNQCNTYFLFLNYSYTINIPTFVCVCVFLKKVLIRSLQASIVHESSEKLRLKLLLADLLLEKNTAG